MEPEIVCIWYALPPRALHYKFSSIWSYRFVHFYNFCSSSPVLASRPAAAGERGVPHLSCAARPSGRVFSGRWVFSAPALQFNPLQWLRLHHHRPHLCQPLPDQLHLHQLVPPARHHPSHLLVDLFVHFHIILLGFIAGKFSFISDVEVRGLGTFYPAHPSFSESPQTSPALRLFEPYRRVSCWVDIPLPLMHDLPGFLSFICPALSKSSGRGLPLLVLWPSLSSQIKVKSKAHLCLTPLDLAFTI